MIWFAAALAQDAPEPESINVQNYRPVMDAERTLWAEDSGKVVKKPRFAGRAFLHYVRNPYVLVAPDGETRDTLVSEVMQLDALAMVHIDRFRLGVYVPLHLMQAGDLVAENALLGDIGLDGRVTVMDRTKNAIGIGLNGRLTLPTATFDAPLAWDTPTGEVFATIDTEFDRWLLTSNLGFRFLPTKQLGPFEFGSQALARIGASFEIVEDVGLSFDVNAFGTVTQITDRAAIPVEGLLGAYGRAGWFTFRGGVGTGFTPGIGAGDLRAVVALGFEPRPSNDPDGDGLVGKDDLCPEQPEDFDGFQDNDGCPDPDNDGDGLLDKDDRCPDEAEDFDGYQDDDGCPDYTTQVSVRVKRSDGLPLTNARSVVEGEGISEAGTSNFALDLHEGAYTVRASAPDFVESSIEFQVPLPQGSSEVVVVLQPDVIMGTLLLRVQDPDGNPLPDPIWYLDGGVGPAPINNGVVTTKLPAGEHTLDIRHEGFVTDRRTISVPEKAEREVIVQLQPSRVEVTKEMIEIRDTVYFDTAKATIQSRSFGLLDDVASVLLDHPEITKVRIEGHTDSRGGADYNRRLSDQRANAVRTYLIEHGVDAGRLEAIGYGEDRPVDPRENEEAWSKNRRVDFFIVERSDD